MKINYKKDGVELDGDFLSLVEITEKCNEIKLKENKLVLLKIHWGGKHGDVLEQIILPSDNATQLKDYLIGREVYFGEIWGKHSEVYGEMEEKDFEIVKDKSKIKSFLNNFPSGHDYDHSFIYTFIEGAEEKLEYSSDSLDEDDATQEELDWLRTLLKY